MKLEPGMRVRCVDDECNWCTLVKGAEYVVSDVGQFYVRVEGSDFQWLRSRFKPVVRVKAPTSRLSNLEHMVERALAWFETLTPVEKEAHRQAQRESWARGEKVLGL